MYQQVHVWGYAGEIPAGVFGYPAAGKGKGKGGGKARWGQSTPEYAAVCSVLSGLCRAVGFSTPVPEGFVETAAGWVVGDGNAGIGAAPQPSTLAPQPTVSILRRRSQPPRS